MGQPEPAGEIADPGPRFRIRPDHDGRRIKTGLAQRVGDGRHGREIVGLDAGKYGSDVGRAMQMGIDGDHAIDASAISWPMTFWLIASPS